MDIQVTCVTKPRRDSPHEHITHVGSGRLVWTREQVIAAIDSRINTYYTLSAGGKRADVEVIREPNKAPYLRTRADRVLTNNLLELPAC